MRFGLLGLLLLVAGLAMGSADAQPFRAGLMRATVPDDTPFEILVAYPTQAAEGSVEAGPFELSASRDAAVAGSAGTRFPLVVFSHGSGRGPGSPLPHGGLLLHLAREGFVVVAPFHSGGGRPFDVRPRQIRKAVEFVQTDPRFAAHVDAARVGAIGFSFGGAVALSGRFREGTSSSSTLARQRWLRKHRKSAEIRQASTAQPSNLRSGKRLRRSCAPTFDSRACLVSLDEFRVPTAVTSAWERSAVNLPPRTVLSISPIL